MILPERFNLADAICKRHKDAVARVALIDVKPAASNTYTYGGIDFISDKFATALAECGIKQGEAVAVILPPSAALVTAHLGALKLGAVVVPLRVGLDQTDVETALTDSNAKAVVADFLVRSKLDKFIGDTSVFIAGDSREDCEIKDGAKSFWREINGASSDYLVAATSATSAAFVFHSTESRGVIHNHSTLFEKLNNFDIKDDPVFWPAADYCSVEVLLGMIYPALWYGRAVVTKDLKISTSS